MRLFSLRKPYACMRVCLLLCACLSLWAQLSFVFLQRRSELNNKRGLSSEKKRKNCVRVMARMEGPGSGFTSAWVVHRLLGRRVGEEQGRLMSAAKRRKSLHRHHDDDDTSYKTDWHDKDGNDRSCALVYRLSVIGGDGGGKVVWIASTRKPSAAADALLIALLITNCLVINKRRWLPEK